MAKEKNEGMPKKMIDLDKVEYNGDRKTVEIFINGFMVKNDIKYEIDLEVLRMKLLQNNMNVEFYKEITVRINKGAMKKQVNIRGFIIGMEVEEWE